MTALWTYYVVGMFFRGRIKDRNPETSLVIIPEHFGNLARYFSGINNSDSKSRKKQVFDSSCCDKSNGQNVRSARYVIDGQIHVLLIAKRDISPGELLMFDYNGLDNNYPTSHFVQNVCEKSISNYSRNKWKLSAVLVFLMNRYKVKTVLYHNLQFKETLGKGSFGVVMRAVDKTSSNWFITPCYEQVAIKIIQSPANWKQAMSLTEIRVN